MDEFCHTVGTQEIEDSMDIESIAKRKQTSEVESTQIQICMSRCRPSLARREKCMRTVSSLKVTLASKIQHLSTLSKDTEHKDGSCPQRKEFWVSLLLLFAGYRISQRSAGIGDIPGLQLWCSLAESKVSIHYKKIYRINPIIFPEPISTCLDSTLS